MSVIRNPVRMMGRVRIALDHLYASVQTGMRANSAIKVSVHDLIVRLFVGGWGCLFVTVLVGVCLGVFVFSFSFC